MPLLVHAYSFINCLVYVFCHVFVITCFTRSLLLIYMHACHRILYDANLINTCCYKMTTSYIIILSDSEDEFVDIPVDPASLHVDDEGEAQAEDPMEAEPADDSDEDPDEDLDEDSDEDLDEDPDEDPDEDSEEGPQEAPQETRYPVLTTRPREPSFRSYRPRPNGPLMMFTPRKRVRTGETFTFSLDDLHTQPSSSGGHRADAIEPTHDLVPQLIARVESQQTEIELLQDSLESLPGTDDFQEMCRDVERLRRDHTDLRNHHGQMGQRVSRDLDDFAERIARLESLMEELRHRISRITQTSPEGEGY